MWRKTAFRFLSMALASALLCPNCATIITRSKQTIPVTSTPVGAKVIVNGVEQGVTPLEIRLVRKQRGQVIRIESPGYNPFEIRPKRTLSFGPILSNFLIGVITGTYPALAYNVQHDEDDNVVTNTLLVWGLTAAAVCGVFTAIDTWGRGYAFSPIELAVTLTKADGTPRVDTMLVDADDFKNVKWIRVRRD